MRRSSESPHAILLIFVAFAFMFSSDRAAFCQVIELGDVTAGGDGTGTAPAENIGIDPRNGDYATTAIDGHIAETDPEGDGLNPSPVDGSEFIDSVFILGPVEDALDPVFSQVITQSGIEYEFPIEDAFGSLWNHILRDSAGGAWSAGAPFLTGGNEFTSGVGLHAAGGITYDLRALRAAHGADSIGCFNTFWGMDDCGGDVNLYVILSSEADGVLETRQGNFTGGTGDLLQIAIDPEVDYLTLATGSNGGDGCDHGSFAVARLTPGECAETEIVSIRLTPQQLTLAPGGIAQLTVTGIDPLAIGLDITSAASGTTYSVDPAGVVTVDADGLVTGVSPGNATISAMNGGLSDTASVTVEGLGYIDLGDIAAGGSGVGDAPLENIGINADLATFAQARLNADVVETTFVNPQPVDGADGADDSPFIDSVFIMDVAVAQVINTAGIEFDFADGDADTGWEVILKGAEPGGPDEIGFTDFGPYDEGLGVHASQGITFDLTALRDEHGAEAVKYLWAIAGEGSGQAAGSINAYMILSNADDVLASQMVANATDSGELVQLEIPEEAQFATFAVGNAGNGKGSDHGVFALARIAPEPVDTTDVESLLVSPSFVILDVGEEQELSVKGVLAGPEELAGVPFTVPSADLAFESENPVVASVSETGVITGESAGRTVVHVTAAGLTQALGVSVGTILELGDITAGGDGTGSAEDFSIGVDPRNGFFAEFPIDGHIYETDPEGDGLDPSPVEDSDFIDSVFILGEPNLPAGEILTQEITQSGIEFEFPSEDGFGSLWNHILRDSAGGVWADGQPFMVGGKPFTSGVGLHAAGGITYDLQALRDDLGEDVVGTFSTTWGMDACGGDVNLYVILSSEGDGVIDSRSGNFGANQGEQITMEIPASVRYLTLACGSNGGDGCDHGSFGDAFLLPRSGGAERTLFRRGDPNDTGGVNISSAVFILSFLFSDAVDVLPCMEAGDINNDGTVNITDPVNLLNHLFGTSPPPAPPGLENCGPDPDEPGSRGDIGCETYTSC